MTGHDGAPSTPTVEQSVLRVPRRRVAPLLVLSVVLTVVATFVLARRGGPTGGAPAVSLRFDSSGIAIDSGGIVLDSIIPSIFLDRAETLINEARFDSARRVLDRVWQKFPEYPQTRLTEAYLAAAQQDWPTAERHIRLHLAAAQGRTLDEINSLQTLGQIALLGGRLAEAEQHLKSALALADSNDLPGHYHKQTILLAWLDLQYHRQPAKALARVDAALRKFPIEKLEPADRPYIELADLFAAARQPARARALLSAAERDSAAVTTLRGAGWHKLRGIVALAEGQGRAAVSELRQADAVDSCTICSLPTLALAQQLADDDDEAIAVYERYLNTPWTRRFETDALHMAFSLQQLALLYQRKNQPARAAEQYTRLLRLWSAADAQLAPALTQVRAILARAGDSSGSRLPQHEQCTAAAAAPALDHVVVVVNNLDTASRAFQNAGFKLKPGRLHANNLLNRHIKFRDGSEIELMTVVGQPGDAMASDYSDLLGQGEGGVYVSLRSTDNTVPDRAAKTLGWATRRTSSGTWQFLSFPPASPAAAIFFASGVPAVHDPDSLVTHDPPVAGLAEAWVEGPAGFAELLVRLGATRCGQARAKSGLTGERWALSRGSIVVVPAVSNARPRVLGVVLQSSAQIERALRPIPQFWVEYQR